MRPPSPVACVTPAEPLSRSPLEVPMSPNSPALHKADEARPQAETPQADAPPALLPPIRRLRVPEERPGEDPEVSRKAQGRRLLAARLKIEYRTASDAARALGIAGPTYLAHEN